MDLGVDSSKLAHYKATAVRLFGDPLKMRLAVVSGAVLLGFVGIYGPLSDKISQRRQQIASEKGRFEAIRDIETLRREVQAYRPRISEKGDTNNWVQFVLAGSRQTEVGLRNMASRPPRQVGPYDGIELSIELAGSYERLKSFVEWLEQSDRLLRVESVRFDLRADGVIMKVRLMGLARRGA